MVGVVFFVFVLWVDYSRWERQSLSVVTAVSISSYEIVSGGNILRTCAPADHAMIPCAWRSLSRGQID